TIFNLGSLSSRQQRTSPKRICSLATATPNRASGCAQTSLSRGEFGRGAATVFLPGNFPLFRPNLSKLEARLAGNRALVRLFSLDAGSWDTLRKASRSGVFSRTRAPCQQPDGMRLHSGRGKRVKKPASLPVTAGS